MSEFSSFLNTDNFKAHFNAALLKVASRCNLNCDYCYMYHHADQSWRVQPKLMDDGIIRLFGQRLDDYVAQQKVPYFSVIFHGGEPLLFSAERLAQATNTIRSMVKSNCILDFSIQTNGVFLTEEAIEVFDNAQIKVSLSLDGPKYANDLHRLDHSGNSTFDETMKALQRLRATSSGIFQGVIAVIDPIVSARELFEFFYPLDIPRLDLLLPDATHANPPIGRKQNSELYNDWLSDAFDLWFNKYSDLPVRFFDAILSSRLNVPSPTDALGFGKVSLIVIETDGSYTDHDVFKITEQGANQLNYNLQTTSFEEVASHPKILEHSFRLSPRGVAQECQSCPVLEACGGGAIMHRYHPKRGIDAPTVYCREMFSLLSKATDLLRKNLDLPEQSSRLRSAPDLLSFSSSLIDECRTWRVNTEKVADEIAQSIGILHRGDIPAAALIIYNESLRSVPFNEPTSRKLSPHVWLNKVRIQSNEPLLRLPFSDSIREIPLGSKKFEYGIEILDLVEQYLATVSPLLPLAISELISDIVFVESTLEGETGIFSFSDDNSPNVLYIDPFIGTEPLPPDDIADSILHEFLHQVLYHAELTAPLLYDYDFPRFPAPWRTGFRPAGGFLHGTFVFSGLSKFWKALAQTNVSLPLINKDKARQNANKFREQANYGIQSVYKFALLTPQGIDFIENLAEHINVPIGEMQPPGILQVS